MSSQLRFSIPEILSLIGLSQCIYILVYMMFRSGDPRRAILPFLYFLVLGLAFFLDFAGDFVGNMFDYYVLAPWAAWFMGPPLCVLLVIQIAQISKIPPPRYFLLPLLVPMAAAAALAVVHRDSNCMLPNCPMLGEWLVISGLVPGHAGGKARDAANRGESSGRYPKTRVALSSIQ